MKRMMRSTGMLLVIVFLLSCTPTIKKPEWSFRQSAVKIHFIADNNLNQFYNMAHTLYVCVYQLEELNAFDQLTANSAGIRRLLDCRLFDKSVASAVSKIIHAGEDITIALDRAERAQYVAVVAGYSSELTNERVVRRYKFKVKKATESFFKQIYQCEPCNLKFEVSLGSNQIEYSKIIPSEEIECSDECK